MNFQSKFLTRSQSLKSLLCVGLDPDYCKLPETIKRGPEPLVHFCREIIDATSQYAVAYKPNIAFFEVFGSEGIRQFEKVIGHLKSNYPRIPIVADIKRGDLDNTARQYARYYFGDLQVDSLTLSPYMGLDSLRPFLEYQDHLVFWLCLTSNPDSSQFQKKHFSETGRTLYEEVAYVANSISPTNLGFVVGATNPHELETLRKQNHDRIFLIPGFGAQGAKLEDLLPVCGTNSLINSSRGIHFASSGLDFATRAGLEAEKIHKSMQAYFSRS
ncbi:orotidine-5'-phosphate decarboxylase [Leptospira stimsonii]|uniref:Orotidine 5'-phosphate decarboxylase n=1 Tax=Leptospira stimsonii TaxID=2202203 RepID=A0A4R9L596_9LEPT|nr:orotidine-5'-phosphate decarboxylase [Leptospira stimsonii]RHX84019.1 orotidine-5'-phosphate decarboxylase [Leptospira stimsonii]TGK20557.1 orotidine-5'-phosphate decarboxylase [Leptospira stimsonii]TGM14346.1 orotidine-5'-phosphate decarboxylase [Leptospira stimsonii]